MLNFEDLKTFLHNSQLWRYKTFNTWFSSNLRFEDIQHLILKEFEIWRYSTLDSQVIWDLKIFLCSIFKSRLSDSLWTEASSREADTVHPFCQNRKNCTICKDYIILCSMFNFGDLRYLTHDSQVIWDLNIFLFNSRVMSEQQLVDRGQLKGGGHFAHPICQKQRFREGICKILSFLKKLKIISLKMILAGGDNWAELHRNRNSAILFLQILP